MNTTLITWGRCEKQSMLFSNLHSFHFAKKLQNATALPTHVYRKINNRRSVNKDADIPPYINTIHQQRQKPVRVKKASQAEISAETTLSPFPGLRDPVVIEGRITRKPPKPTPPIIKDVVATKPKQKAQSPASAAARSSHEASTVSIKSTPPSPPPQIPQITKRNVWKPGHGTIEKVDKLTGEIVHLTEEYIGSEKITAISSI